MAKQEQDKNKKVKRPTAQKRELQAEKRRLINKACRSEIKTAIRVARHASAQADKEAKFQAMKAAYSLLDKAVNKGVIKQNKASRLKSRLAASAHKTA